MDMLKRLESNETKLAVVGLGYVGMPLAAAFSKKFSVVGFDQNEKKVELYRQGIDPTEEIGSKGLKECNIDFTTDASRIEEASFIVVAVPTPINGDKTPDLLPVKGATETVGKHLTKGSIVVYESTVYPGVTEDICVPILEKESGLKCGVDFKIGYSPERINPGDKVHRLKNITKIVSGMDEDSLEDIASVYDSVIDNIYRAPDIKVAEAAKLVENSQRDINIAFMNELAMVFHRMGINTNEVVKAMNTKWNALGFYPGLVGGHCIGVDPYYFIYEAENLGYHSQIIAAGRRINNGMSDFVAQEIVKALIRSKIDPSTANIYLLGMSFKEDCPDTRNSRPVDVYRRLEEYGLRLKAVDPAIDKDIFEKEYGIELTDYKEVRDADCLVFLVAHEAFRKLTEEEIRLMFTNRPGIKHVLVDVKSIFSSKEMEKAGYEYWSL